MAAACEVTAAGAAEPYCDGCGADDCLRKLRVRDGLEDHCRHDVNPT